jgi:sec-independent protein translocase protein TatC
MSDELKRDGQTGDSEEHETAANGETGTSTADAGQGDTNEQPAAEQQDTAADSTPGDGTDADTGDAAADDPSAESADDNNKAGAENAPALSESVPPVPAVNRVTEAAADEEEDEDERPMTLLEHLDELRFRLVRCCIAVGIGFLACYGFAEQLFGYLVAPLLAVMPETSTLIFTELPEAFFTYLKISIVAGMFLTSPYIFYQIWAFIAPGLYDEEKKYIIPMAGVSALFFASGACFGYFIVFPFAFDFFMSFNNETIQAMPKLGEYLGFSLKLLIAFGLIFEMPLFAFFGARIGILTAAAMRKARKVAVLCFFIVAAILTPPDVISQLLMAGPLLLLYEVSIYVAKIFGRSAKAGGQDEDENDEQEETA